MKSTELSNYSYTKIENDPRTALSKGSIITDVSTKDTYEINELIGSGGSALVYKASKKLYSSAKEEACLLKEIYPKNYDFDIIRSSKMKNGLKCEYFDIDELISVYIKATDEEIKIHNEVSTDDKGYRYDYFFGESSMFTADNNIKYVVLDTVKGINFQELINKQESKNISDPDLQKLINKLEIKTLSDICGYMIPVVNALGYLHKKNILHLDLSPDNLFVSDTETKEEYRLRIIDYNSAREYVEGKGVSVLHGLSSKQEFEAPEVSIYKPDIYAKSVPIDHRADLFSVAAIFYYILFNDSVLRTENTYANEGKIMLNESEYFKKIPYTAQKLTREFLLKGLSKHPDDRYQSCDEMREALMRIKNEAEKEVWLIPSNHMEEPQYCVPRKRQIEEIDRILEEKNHIFISGIGGSGKTTLATLYALANKEKYHTVRMETYSSSTNAQDERLKELERTEGLKGLVASLEFSGIDDNKYVSSSGYDIDSMYKAKMDALSKYTDNNTLLIIDNINTVNDNDENCLEALLEKSQCRIIFTTRIWREEDDYYCPDINEGEALLLLQKILEKKPDKREQTDNLKMIIKLTNKHYLLTKMVGLFLSAFPVEISYVIDKLNKGESFENGKIEIDKNDGGKRGRNKTTIESYLLKIFDLSIFDDDKKFILSAMTIVPYSGMDKDKFIKALGIDIFDNNINELIRLGWITENQNVISLHQVISDLLYRTEGTKPNWERLDSFISSEEYNELCHIPYNDNVAYKQRIKLRENADFVSNKLKGESLNCSFVLDNVIGVYEDEKYLDVKSLQKAIEICLKVIEIREKLLSTKHQYTISANRTLAQLYEELGRFTEAEKILIEQLHICREIYGENNYETASCYMYLSFLYKRMGKSYEADELFQIYHMYLRKEAERDNLLISEELFNNKFGMIKCNDDKLNDTLIKYKNSLKMRKQVFGEKHYFTVEGLLKVSCLLYEMHNYVEAKEYCQEALQIFEYLYGNKDKRTIEIRDLLLKVDKQLEPE